MSSAEPLALSLDSQTNNQSLALAIEIEPGGRVLLFPGDAQSSQWRNWARLRWPRDSSAATQVSTAELLSRTVLFKVGHHGAATATPTVGGLELMSSPDLVAMVSVDSEIANGLGWRFPCSSLVERLVKSTRGRLLRSDYGFPDRPDGVTTGEWAAFRESVHIDQESLFIDYHIRV